MIKMELPLDTVVFLPIGIGWNHKPSAEGKIRIRAPSADLIEDFTEIETGKSVKATFQFDDFPK
jgi:hypothetical protein